MPEENLREKKIENKKILITGAAGLVGNELLKQLLDAGLQVRATYNSTPLSGFNRATGHQPMITDYSGSLQVAGYQSPVVPTIYPNLEIVPCDILDVVALEEAMKGITHVYHCAGIVSFDPKDKHHLLKINIEGTSNVVNACIDAGVTKLVHVSSVAALGRIQKGEIITEKMNWAVETSSSIYGKSKYLGELEVWRGIGEGLRAVIVNPAIILGGDNWESGSSAIFKTAFNEFQWYAEGISGFVDVRDVARAMRLLMNSEISAQRFIISSENLSYRELFSYIAKCFVKKPPYKKVTPFLAELVWRFEAIKSMFKGKRHLLTKETARSAQEKVYFDNSKILKALPGFQFTNIKETISHTCALLKEKYHL